MLQLATNVREHAWYDLNTNTTMHAEYNVCSNIKTNHADVNATH